MNKLKVMSGSPCGPAASTQTAGSSGSTYDADLQNAIDEATLRLMFPASREDCVRAMDELRELKAQQRPERVEQLEREKGLRP